MVDPLFEISRRAAAHRYRKTGLQFDSQPQDGKTLLTVTAYFAPHGLFGFLYWYAMWPFHKFIFDGLARQVASRARVLAHAY